MADVFISYSRRNLAEAEDLVHRLREHGCSVWYDQELVSGDRFRRVIANEINNASVVLVLWPRTKPDGHDDPYWLAAEAEHALKCNKPLVQAYLSKDVKLDLPFSERQATSLVGYYARESHEGVDRLVADVLLRLGRLPARHLEDYYARMMRRVRYRLRQARYLTSVGAVAAFTTIVGIAEGLPGAAPIRLFALHARHKVAPLEPSCTLRVALIDEQTVRALKRRDLLLTHDAITRSIHVGDIGPTWRAWQAKLILRASQAQAKVIAFDLSFDRAGANDDEIDSTRALAEAIEVARDRGTSVVIVATKRDAGTGALGVDDAIQRALTSDSKGRGIVAHACLGTRQGTATLLPLAFSGEPMFSLALSSVAAHIEGELSWSPSNQSVNITTSNRLATPVELTGVGPPLKPADNQCDTIITDERAALRVLDPFPEELSRKSPRVIPFENLLDDSAASRYADELRGKILLVGQQADESHPDRHATCLESGCRDIWGLSLQAAAIDALSVPGRPAIQVISPWSQLWWIGMLCLTSGSVQFLTRRRWLQLTAAVGLLTFDLLVCLALARWQGLLVDTGFHVAAALSVYLAVCLYQRQHSDDITS